jgi:ABC-type antimicrobial peptide transport system permease subunit
VPIAGPGAGEWDLALRRRHLKIAVPLLVVLTVVLVAVFADALAPFDPTAQHLTYRLRPPR